MLITVSDEDFGLCWGGAVVGGYSFKIISGDNLTWNWRVVPF